MDLHSLRGGRSIAFSCGCLYIVWYTVFITLHGCVIILTQLRGPSVCLRDIVPYDVIMSQLHKIGNDKIAFKAIFISVSIEWQALSSSVSLGNCKFNFCVRFCDYFDKFQHRLYIGDYVTLCGCRAQLDVGHKYPQQESRSLSSFDLEIDIHYVVLSSKSGLCSWTIRSSTVFSVCFFCNLEFVTLIILN